MSRTRERGKLEYNSYTRKKSSVPHVCVDAESSLGHSTEWVGIGFFLVAYVATAHAKLPDMPQALEADCQREEGD